MTEQQEANFQKWMTALRSGRFKRGTLGLYHYYDSHEGECFCALGVAFAVCNLSWKESIVALADAIGFRNGIMRKVMDLNDKRHLPFPAIADEIERNKFEWFETAGAAA